jgi:hypothetical protein
MHRTYIKRSNPVLSEFHCVMLEITFMDCSPTNSVSLLTNRLTLKRFWAYRSDSKNFRNYFLFATCRKSLNNQSAVSVFKFTANLDILPHISLNIQWGYSGICRWLFFRKCVILILIAEDYDFGGASYIVFQISFSSVPGCCHLHCCARINSISSYWAGSVVVTLYSLYIF